MKVVPVKIVLCDVGNVLVLADHTRTHKVLEKMGVPPDRAQMFYANADYPAFAVCEITGQQFYERLVQNHLCCSLSMAQVIEAHHAQIYELDEAVVHLVHRINVPVHIATDTNDWQDARMSQLIELEKFGRVFKSSSMGMLKTDNGMLTKICTCLDTDPAHVLLIDDNLKVVTQAQNESLQTHLFTDAATLEVDLHERGLIA